MAERIPITDEARNLLNVFRWDRGLKISRLSAISGVERHTVAGLSNGKLRSATPETFGQLFNALRLNRWERFDIWRSLRVQIPLGGIFRVIWESKWGSVGDHVDQIMVETGVDTPEKQQAYANWLLPRAYSGGVVYGGLGPEIANNLPL